MLRPILSVSTSAALYLFQIKIWHVMEFSIRNHAFRKSTKNVKYVVFTEWNEAERDLLNANIFSESNFLQNFQIFI